MGDLIHNLGIDWKILIAQIINFTLLLIVLKKLAYKPILRALSERRAKIEEALERSKQIDQKMREIESLKQEVLAAARVESETIIKKSEAIAARVQEEVLAETHAQSDRMREETKKKIEAEREKIFAEIKRDIALLVTGAIEKTVGDIIDERAQEKLTDEALRIIQSSK